MANRPVNTGSGGAATPPPVHHDAAPATPATPATSAAPASHRATASFFAQTDDLFIDVHGMII